MGAIKADQFTTTQLSFARTAKAIGHPARIAIVQTLYRQIYASNLELSAITKLSETTVHQHLQELLRAGLISGFYHGKFHYYRMSDQMRKQIESLTGIFEEDVK